MNITDRVILHDETFYNDEGEEYKLEVDMVEVTLMNSNPDLYADTCEEFLLKPLHELAHQKMLQMMVDTCGKESLGGYVTSEMMSRYPELVEVLLGVESDHSYDQLTDYFMSVTMVQFRHTWRGFGIKLVILLLTSKTLHYCNHSLTHIMGTRSRIGIKPPDGSILSPITTTMVIPSGWVVTWLNTSTPTIRLLSSSMVVI